MSKYDRINISLTLKRVVTVLDLRLRMNLKISHAFFNSPQTHVFLQNCLRFQFVQLPSRVCLQ